MKTSDQVDEVEEASEERVLVSDHEGWHEFEHLYVDHGGEG